MINYIMPNIVMSDELSFESKKHVKLAVESLQYKKLDARFQEMRDNLAEIKRKRNIDQLKEISKYGLY
jgi:homoserine kinase